MSVPCLSGPILDLGGTKMLRVLARPLVAACVGLALSALAAQPALAAGTSLGSSASCSGTIHTTISTTGASVSGSITCTAATTLALTTVLNASGTLSSATSLQVAAPNVSTSINSSFAAARLTSACAVLLDAGTGATISSSCAAKT